MFKTLLTADSPLKNIKLEKLAKQEGFIRRNSRSFSAFGLLMSLMKCVIAGKGSFHQIASHLKDFELLSCSRQAVYQRINAKCVKYLAAVNRALLANHAKDAAQVCRKWGLHRILTEDSTFQRMHPDNAGDYPAHGNKSGETAGFKVDLIFDLLTGKPVWQGLFGGTQQDKKLGLKILELVKKSDLVLRDMGYFSAQIFRDIENKGAHWLSRLPANVKVKLDDATPIEKLLRSRSNTRLDLKVLVGDGQMPCRLVAVRADDKLAAKRRRARKKACKNGKPSKQSLIRDGWHILLTSLDDDHDEEGLFEIYRLRWNIEVRFKAWKQAIRMKKLFNRASNYHHQEALIHTAMIFQLITLKVAAQLDLSGKALSLENFAGEIARTFNTLTRSNCELSFYFDPRHIVMEKRKRKALMDQLLTS